MDFPPRSRDAVSSEATQMFTIHTFARSRPRLAMSILIGAAMAMLAPASSHWVTRILIGWNAAVWCYLALMAWLMTHASHVDVRRIAEQEDNSAVIVLAILTTAAIASLVAIVMELSTVRQLPNADRVARYLLTGATVLGTWLFIGILFTFHYARLFYQAATDRMPLDFPEKESNPDYWDSLYFSFTIAASCATGDVNIMSREMRKTTLAQIILSFFFNVAILGLAINIAAGVVGA
jgi:uncharacterized membrane protein